MSAPQPFRWTPARERAALLVADDAIPDKQIAAEIGISERHLERWKRRPEFAERIAAIRDETRAKLVALGIADKQNRIDAYNARWRLMRQVIAERGADPAMQAVPGGTTGLLVKSYTFSPQGDPYEEYAVDTGLLKELREHEKQAATELSQWVEKKDVTSGGKSIEFTIEIDRRERDEP